MNSNIGSWTVTNCDLPIMTATNHKPNGPFQGPNNNNTNTDILAIGSILNICHFNVEGLSKSKSECLSNLLIKNKVDVLALQETHVEDIEDSARGSINGYRLVDAIGHRAYGVATYVRQDIDHVSVTHKNSDGDIFILAVKVSDTTIGNIYKPPNIQWPDTVLPPQEQPVLYVGDFNSHHSQWGYSSDDNNGIRLVTWAESNNLNLVFDAKDASTFYSARWRRGYCPDLCYSSSDRSSKPLTVGRKVLAAFPHSQHRPVLISVGIQIPLIRSFPRPRWNFCKADWEAFSNRLDNGVRYIPPTLRNYDRFTKLILSTAKACIPRGFRKEYIPGWSQECEDLHEEFNNTGNSDVADRLLYSLNDARRKKWEKTVEHLNFTRSSRKAWSLLRKLSSGKPLNERVVSHPDPGAIAKRIVGLSRPARQPFDKNITYHLNEVKKSQQAPLEVSRPFTSEELQVAVSALTVGKAAAGLDGIFPEFLKHAGARVRQWLLTVFNCTLLSGQMLAAFKISKIIAVLKSGKDPKDVEIY